MLRTLTINFQSIKNKVPDLQCTNRLCSTTCHNWNGNMAH
jgi:hypothetical protein